MIKIIKKPEEVKEVKCQFCGCTLEYSDVDVKQTASEKLGDVIFLRAKLPSIVCPNCENIITLSKEEHFKPDVWPDFYSYDGPNVKRLTDEEISQYIDKCVKNTMQNKDMACMASGDTFVLSLPDCDNSGEIETISVIVAQGYKEGLVYEREGLC